MTSHSCERDNLFWMCQLDLTAAAVLLEDDQLHASDAKEICAAVRAIEASTRGHAERPTDYLDVQKELTRRVGAKSTHIHIGRSRQDMLVTVQRLRLRDDVLALYQGLLSIREKLLALAAANIDALCPAYTNGVQAQPVRVAHLLIGYENSLARSTARIQSSYQRLNASPLGGAALATSSYRLDRHALAGYLGFDSIIDNAFDAVQLSAIDLCTEAASISEIAALSIGTLVQDIHTQYHHVRPWLVLAKDGLQSPSTLMPQKRNPVALNRARLLASQVLGAASAARMAAHNVCSGMTDYKRNDAEGAVETAVRLTREMISIVDGMQIDHAAGSDEISKEYSTTSELANALYRDHGIPFLVGHAFASRLVTFGRQHQLRASEIPFDNIKAIYREALSEAATELPEQLPMSEVELHQALDAHAMVDHYAGIGGSQRAEVERMLGASSNTLAQQREWLATTEARLEHAQQALEARLSALT
ncbi:lyase family protein [Carnimonas bestiolae]|uniref:lyase family protein n=1 Tax=Carnimonas bestiolae TaxID=3402172 RepID=UPI003EDC4AF3